MKLGDTFNVRGLDPCSYVILDNCLLHYSTFNPPWSRTAYIPIFAFPIIQNSVY